MGNVDRRRPEPPLELQDLGARLEAKCGVEIGERLVHQEGGGLAHDRAAESNPLALAAREGPRLPREAVLEVESGCRIVDAAIDLGSGEPAELEAEREVLGDRHVRVERVVLEDHRDIAVLGGDVVDDTLADQDRPVADLLESRHHPERRRLAAAGWADEHHELALCDRQRQRVDRPRPVRVDLRDLVELDGGHSAISL